MHEGKISAGSFDLNKWLYGGYDIGIITTIYGAAGSGKTNFCLLAAVSQAKKNSKVLFIDTEGGFSTERVKQLSQDYENTLKNILLLKPTSFEEQIKAVSSINKEIKSGNISLIVVDGMTMLYRLRLAEAKEDIEKVREVNAELAKQMKLLAEIARTKNIAVLATNQVYSEFLSDEDFRAGKKPETKMVGGDILKYWSKCLIELKNENSRRVALLKKHRSLPEKTLYFYITNEGIRKKGWL